MQLFDARAHRRHAGGLLNAAGPLFAGPPAAGGIPWLHVLPLAVALPAILILLVGLVRGRLPRALGAAGVLLPIGAYLLGTMLLLEDSKRTQFCGSCHLMTPILRSVQSNDGSLASTHFAHGRVPHAEACYTCHSGYGIWGTVDAKKAGIMHMVRTVTGRYDLPIQHIGPFDIDSCLNCHAHAATFRAVEAHQDPDLQQQLVSRELACTGACHPPAHPEAALNGGRPAA